MRVNLLTIFKETKMRKQVTSETTKTNARDIVLIGKIYQSFEALEETLGKLKMEEPLFITHVAKKSFAEIIFKNVTENEQKRFKEEQKKNLTNDYFGSLSTHFARLTLCRKTRKFSRFFTSKYLFILD